MANWNDIKDLIKNRFHMDKFVDEYNEGYDYLQEFKEVHIRPGFTDDDYKNTFAFVEYDYLEKLEKAIIERRKGKQTIENWVNDERDRRAIEMIKQEKMYSVTSYIPVGQIYYDTSLPKSQDVIKRVINNLIKAVHERDYIGQLYDMIIKMPKELKTIKDIVNRLDKLNISDRLTTIENFIQGYPSLSVALNHLKDELFADLERKIIQAKDELSKQIPDIRGINADIISLQDRLANIEKPKSDALFDKINDLDFKLKEIQPQIAKIVNLEENVGKLLNEELSNKENILKNIQNIKKITEQIIAIQEAFKKINDSISDANNILRKEYQDEHVKIRDDIEIIKQQINNVDTRINDLTNSIKTMNDKVIGLEGDIIGLKREIKPLSDKITLLDTKYQELIRAIDVLNAKPGLVGPQGLTGDQGPQGDKGKDGINGLPGPKGDKGDTPVINLDDYVKRNYMDEKLDALKKELAGKPGKSYDSDITDLDRKHDLLKKQVDEIAGKLDKLIGDKDLKPIISELDDSNDLRDRIKALEDKLSKIHNLMTNKNIGFDKMSDTLDKQKSLLLLLAGNEVSKHMRSGNHIQPWNDYKSCK
ncbi:collagen triple helix repeat containing protein [Klosneuvirus KNV1]|uniref:Collagen triple helix repeat containing protein n=1 Tax=Klosneuvirus KNV1 TaxID=1977640 RepID=A0A1V0SLB3_9VIRU|nr:collagen triple helix repeat containing protein [Klosneuvirus KNV1]